MAIPSKQSVVCTTQMSGTCDTQAARVSQSKTTVVQIYPKMNKSDINNLLHPLLECFGDRCYPYVQAHIHPLLKKHYSK